MSEKEERADCTKELLQFAREGNLAAIKRIHQKNPNLVEEILASKDAHDKNYHGYTPLHWACLNDRLDFVEWLVTHGKAFVEAQDSDEWTPLHRACFEGHLPIVEWLVTEGKASVGAKTKKKDDALSLSKVMGHRAVTSFLERQRSESSTNANATRDSTALQRENITLKQCNSELEEAEAKSTLESSLAECIKEELEQVRTKLETMELNRDQQVNTSEAALQDMNEKMCKVMKELMDLKEKLTRFENNQTNLQASNVALEETNRSMDSAIAELQTSRAQSDENLQRVTEELQQVSEQLRKATEEVDALKAQAMELEGFKAQANKNLQKANEQITTLESQTEELQLSHKALADAGAEEQLQCNIIWRRCCLIIAAGVVIFLARSNPATAKISSLESEIVENKSSQMALGDAHEKISALKTQLSELQSSKAILEEVDRNQQVSPSEEEEEEFFDCDEAEPPLDTDVHSMTDLEDFKLSVKEGMTSMKELRELHSAVFAQYPRFVKDYIADHRDPSLRGD